MTLTISRDQHDHLLAIAASSPDHEVCGLLLGEGRHVREIRQARNVAARPERTFEIDPAALFAAIREERAGDRELIGYFHSHPTGDARPSRSDHDQSTGDSRIWVIVAGGMLSAWQRAKSAFVEIEIVTN